MFQRFSDNKGEAGRFMEGHNRWITRGFDDGVFLVVGSLQPDAGGGIVAHNTSLRDLQARVNDDPFVAEKVVSAEIFEKTLAKADDRLSFLLSSAATEPRERRPRRRGGVLSPSIVEENVGGRLVDRHFPACGP